MLTKEVLKSLLVYDKLTGIFTRNYSNRRVKKGSVAGGIDLHGYINISVNKKLYKAHRLAWLYEFGMFPNGDIDHINGQRSDNRLENLRDVSRFVNLQNLRQAKSNSKTKLLGAFPAKIGFQSSIKTNGVKVCLGTYTTAEEANRVYIKAKSELHNSPSTSGIPKQLPNISSRAYRNSKTGVRGVIPYQDVYRAEICVNKKRISLGYFKSVEAAKNAYLAAKHIQSRGF